MNGIGDFVASIKETQRLAAQIAIEIKGDAPGHPFRGNQWEGGRGGSSIERKQPLITGDNDLSRRANKIIDQLPDALVPPYKSMVVEKRPGISGASNNKIIIGDMPGMSSDSVMEHEIIHTVAPKYRSDYTKSVSDAGQGKIGESSKKYEFNAQNVTEDFTASAHAYLSETRNFHGPTFGDAKRAGMLNDGQIEARRGYFKRLIGD